MAKIQAKFIESITVIDPDFGGEVEVHIFKEEGGGIFGVDASFIAEELPVYSPFNKGKIDDDCLDN